MNDMERFKAVCRFEQPDYVPIFAFLGGGSGLSWGVHIEAHRHLVETGMPEQVGGRLAGDDDPDVESWYRFWGTTGPVHLGHGSIPIDLNEPFKTETRIEGDMEITESETGAVTRRQIGKYSMPHFASFDVRGMKSWVFYRDRLEGGLKRYMETEGDSSPDFKDRTRPLAVSAGSAWAAVRALMGPEGGLTVLHDDPPLAHEIIDFFHWWRRIYTYPLIERLRPEIVCMGEDCCYNHGMLMSPATFREFCGQVYRETAQVVRDCGADVFSLDTDGHAMECVPMIEDLGVNMCFPFEAKANNDLFALRDRHPRMLFGGWLEKEVINEGNAHLIENEIMSKVPLLLEKGGYFPNTDHGLQPMITFQNLCKFMTLLHEVTGNPEGEFPRMRSQK